MLSIQSAVAYGHVGNSIATFALQRLGHEVIAVNTTQLSNHTGYDSWRGSIFTSRQVEEVIQGLEELGVLADVDLVLSGYLGNPEVAAVVLDAVRRTRKANPAAQYACDPVIGNADRGRYVDPAIPGLLREKILPVSDIATPNQFELGALLGRDLPGSSVALSRVLDAADELRERGPRIVVVTSLTHRGLGPHEIGMLVVSDQGRWQLRTPRLDLNAHGSGDLTAALFVANLDRGGSAGDALARTAGAVFDIVSGTLRDGSQELDVIRYQDLLATPLTRVEIEPLT